MSQTWTEPASDGGAAITKYQYRVSADGGSNWSSDWTDVHDGTDAGSDLADERSLTVTSLDNGTTYTFELRAVNSVGESIPAEAMATPQDFATAPGVTRSLWPRTRRPAWTSARPLRRRAPVARSPSRWAARTPCPSKIVSSTGQLQTKSALDYETKSSYEVTVTAADSNGATVTTVTIEVTNVIELTAITGPEAFSFAENGAGRVATYTASYEEDRYGVVWTVAGTDGAHFTSDAPGGALRFHIDPVDPNIFPKLPNFESPDDADTSNDYTLTVMGSDGTDSIISDVTVTVTDVDEAGAVSLSSTRPALGAALTVVLRRPGPGVTDGTAVWQWERSTGSQLLGRDRRLRRRELHAGGGGHEHVSSGDGELRGRARDRQDGQRGGAQRRHGATADGSDGGDRSLPRPTPRGACTTPSIRRHSTTASGAIVPTGWS